MPKLFYVFRRNGDFEIEALTPEEASKLNRHDRWIDFPQKTHADAEELIAAYRAEEAGRG
jgi:hypothetical protein